ncbi:MAG: hypothetical protein COV52_07235 [Gammaproteobacteria bacterium CG11_big_fil_rev_8_21_14_0_20_46_22]|nr:MAG: hypothetical protein COW05_00250 [Gammaproteobacteria bacterium CG12_big_fil_rev_8_21_14_0_65_46_12]PIR10827.1 MAG: hypothetical protein COV52_07235 [Gammaproteobacteria bacterium CG11_big_fil_rev_8_21_14_0_20_46_22]
MRIKALVAAISLATVSTAVLAADGSSKDAAALKEVTQEMQAMQKQMAALQQQVGTLKAQLKHRQHVNRARHNTTDVKTEYGHLKGAQKHYVVNTPGYVHFGNSVVLAPATGVPAHYDGSSFIINAPSINENIELLNRTKKAMEYYKKEMGEWPSLPRLVLSGDVVGIAQYSNTYQGKSNSDIDLTGADLMAQAVVTPWVSGLMEFSYDNSAAVDTDRGLDNSRIYLNQGYVTIGNFMKSPIFGSLGQLYVPFGRYSSIMISDPLTKYLGKTKARALEVGYRSQHDNRPYAEAFVYRGAASTSSDPRINNGGVDVGYNGKVGKFTANVGVSAVRNMADVDGMQDTGSSAAFTGFNQSSTAENIDHVVHAADVHTNLGYGNFTVLAEYLSALRRFSANDISYNGRGAKPSAYTVEGDYNFHMLNMPVTFGLSYGRSYQALGFNIPEARYLAALQLAIRRYTLLTFEFRHDTNYGKSSSATHNEAGTIQTAYDPSALGKSSNAITAQLGIYF